MKKEIKPAQVLDKKLTSQLAAGNNKLKNI